MELYQIPAGKAWRKSLGEEFREPGVGSVCAGDVEGGRAEISILELF